MKALSGWGSIRENRGKKNKKETKNKIKRAKKKKYTRVKLNDE
jgi:hypothetical protein